MGDPKQELIKAEQESKSNLLALPEKPQEALLAIIQGATQTPNVDINLIEKLWGMQQEAEDRDAEQAYWAAMPKLQADLPLIPKNGMMKITKNDKSWTIPFAKFEDVIEAIRPIMKKNGFSLTFKHKNLERGIIHTTGIVAHKKGHKETDEFESEPDTTGSKNKTQAVGSARSYGKRYTTGSLLGLAFGGEDDDGDDDGLEDHFCFAEPVGAEGYALGFHESANGGDEELPAENEDSHPRVNTGDHAEIR